MGDEYMRAQLHAPEGQQIRVWMHNLLEFPLMLSPLKEAERSISDNACRPS